MKRPSATGFCMPLCLLSFLLMVPPNHVTPGTPIRAGCFEPILSGPSATCISINQLSISQQIDQSTTHQPILQSVNQSINQSINQSTNSSVKHSYLSIKATNKTISGWIKKPSGTKQPVQKFNDCNTSVHTEHSSLHASRRHAIMCLARQ